MKNDIIYKLKKQKQQQTNKMGSGRDSASFNAAKYKTKLYLIVSA